jgi:hypothetical protein
MRLSEKFIVSIFLIVLISFSYIKCGTDTRTPGCLVTNYLNLYHLEYDAENRISHLDHVNEVEVDYAYTETSAEATVNAMVNGYYDKGIFSFASDGRCTSIERPDGEPWFKLVYNSDKTLQYSINYYNNDSTVYTYYDGTTNVSHAEGFKSGQSELQWTIVVDYDHKQNPFRAPVYQPLIGFVYNWPILLYSENNMSTLTVQNKVSNSEFVYSFVYQYNDEGLPIAAKGLISWYGPIDDSIKYLCQ